MKHWNEFENQDVANLLSGISFNLIKLKNKLSNEDYQGIAGDLILLKNKLIVGNRHSRFEDISDLYPKIENEKVEDK